MKVNCQYIRFILILNLFLACQKKDPVFIINPEVKTFIPFDITKNSVKIKAEVKAPNGVSNQYKSGVCFADYNLPLLNVSTNKEFNKGLGAQTITIENLESNKTYYVRAYSEYNGKVWYGDIFLFRTFKGSIISNEGDDITDIDGNTYKTIVLGNGQEWMAENLQTSNYKNGESITKIEENSEWFNVNAGAWSYYDNKENENKKFGKLYNWHAAVDTRGICPNGWRVPTKEDISKLIDYLDDKALVSTSGNYFNYAGTAIKTTGYTYWENGEWNLPLSNPNAFTESIIHTNESNFSALPSGYRKNNGSFTSKTYFANWWTQSRNTLGAYRYSANSESTAISISSTDENSGFCIRCIKE